MILRYFLFLPLFAFQAVILKCYAQTDSEAVSLLAEKSITIDPGHLIDEATLSYFDKAFAGKQIVLLGEQNHRDGSTFQLYSELVKLLHGKYGFEIIVFESGFYDCHRAWEHIQNNADPYTAFRNSIFPVWTKSKQAQPLFEYIKDQSHSDNPLQLAGFDCQITGSFGIENFMMELDSVVRKLDPKYSDSEEYKSFLRTSSNATNFKSHKTITQEEMATFQASLIRISRMLEDYADKEHSFWHQNLQNLKINIALRRGMETGSISPRELINMRDKQMANNVIWQLEGPFKGKKIILWGNVSHFLRNAASMTPTLERDLFNGAVTMGDHLYQKYNDKIYLIGSLSYHGEAGYTGNEDADPAPKGSLNHLFHLTNQRFAFMDLNQMEEMDNLLSKPIGARLDGSITFKADWTNIFDGILFIDYMEASKRITE